MTEKPKENMSQIRFFCRDRTKCCAYYVADSMGICKYYDRLECRSMVANMNAVYLAGKKREKILKGENNE